MATPQDVVTKRIQEMTKEEFAALPEKGWNEQIGEFDSLVIIPTDDVHDGSNYRIMDFVPCVGDTAICLISGSSDIIHVDGIGGMGDRYMLRFKASWKDRMEQKIMAPVDWSIDCLKVSGLLRLFTSAYNLRAGDAYSSFEVFTASLRLGGG